MLYFMIMITMMTIIDNSSLVCGSKVKYEL